MLVQELFNYIPTSSWFSLTKPAIIIDINPTIILNQQLIETGALTHTSRPITIKSAIIKF